MAKLLCVFSTLASSTTYVDYNKPVEAGALPTEGDSVTIKGGAGVADAHLYTPRGVATMVTEAQAEMLKRNPVFQLHAKNGFVAIDTVERPPQASDADLAAAGLEGRDKSAPLVQQDYEINGQTAPTSTKRK